MRALRRRLVARPAPAPLESLPKIAVFAGYHPLGGEIDPEALIDQLRDAGATLVMPVCERPNGALIFRRYRPGDLLVPDAMGVPAPSPAASILLPDLLIVPLLAFDRQGGRLGQGGGYYDRTLAALRAVKPVFALGLAYSGQEVAQVPTAPHDQRLDAILTEIGYIAVSKP